MSTVHAFPVPELLWWDWAVVFAGLGIGIGTVFQLLSFSLPPGMSAKQVSSKVYTLTNFWLVLSGVIHVSHSAFPFLPLYPCRALYSQT